MPSTAPSAPTAPLVHVDAVSKAYRVGDLDTPVLDAVSFDLGRGETTSLVGASGSGKSAAEEKNIVKVAAGAGQFDTLVAAVKAGGLVETLSGPGPFTVFAPTDEAFAKLPKGTVDNLLKPENKDFRIDRSLDSRHLHVGNRFLAARMAGLRRWRPI